MHTAWSATTGHIHTCKCTCLHSAYPPHTCACLHAGLQLQYLPQHTHAQRHACHLSLPVHLPVLAGGPLAELAEALVQPSAAGAAEPQRQGQPQQRDQQQGGGQGAPPCGERHVSPPRCTPCWLRPRQPHKAPFSRRTPPACALTSLQGGRATVLAAPRAGALAGRGGPALLAVAVPVVVAHLSG